MSLISSSKNLPLWRMTEAHLMSSGSVNWRLRMSV